MKLTLNRKPSTDIATIGELSIDGQWFCYTLERPEVQIAPGIYDIELTYSPRFNRLLPLLNSVPDRMDTRMHSGNWPRDTEGCILVGYQAGSNMILQSRAALDDLVPKIQAAIDAGGGVRIEVS